MGLNLHTSLKLRSSTELDAVEDRVSNSESSDDDSSDSDQRQGKKGKLSPTEKPMSEKNTSPARPGVAVRALSGYHKLLEKAMEQLPHKKKAIEKSIKKVSAWLVTSRGEHATNVSEETGDNEKGIAGQNRRVQSLSSGWPVGCIWTRSSYVRETACASV